MLYSLDNPEHCNISRWDKETKGKFFETYYVKWNDIKRQLSGWMRYTILQSPEKFECAVWGILLNEKSPERNIAIKNNYDLSDIETSRDKFCLQIGKAAITQKSFTGSVEENGQSLAWDIQLPEKPFLIKHFAPSLYKSPLLKTKFLAPFCWGKISGKVVANGEEITITDVIAHEGHFWGTQQIVGWAWANCGHFNEDETFHFEGVSAKVKMFGIPIPLTTNLFFFWKNKLYAANTVVQSIKNSSSFDIYGWSFKARCADVTFVGKITSDPEKMIIYRFEDPDGSYRYSHNNFFARLEIDILDNKTQKTLAKMTSDISSYEFTNSMQNNIVTQKVGF